MSKGVAALVDGGWNEDDAYRWGTLMLFGGMLATALLDLLVHAVSHCAGKNKNIDANTVPEVKSVSDRQVQKVDAGMEEGKAGPSASSTGEIVEPVDKVPC